MALRAIYFRAILLRDPVYIYTLHYSLTVRSNQKLKQRLSSATTVGLEIAATSFSFPNSAFVHKKYPER